MGITMTPKVLEDGFLVVENLAFLIERMLTIFVTPLWIYSFFSFLAHSKISPLFNFGISLFTREIIFTNLLYLLLLTLREAYDHYHNKAQHERELQAAAVIEKTWHSEERYGFWLDRCGMLILLVILEFPQGFSYLWRFRISFLPCLILFPVANFLYLWRFVFGEESKTRVEIVECGLYCLLKFDEYLFLLREKLDILINWIEEEKSDTDTENTEEERDDDLTDLEEVIEEQHKQVGLETEQGLSEESFEMVDHDQHDEIKEGIHELEQEIAKLKDNYRKKLKKVEDKWEKKVTEVRKKYMEKRQICKNLEKEKNELMMKLCSANSSSALYQSLLRDQLLGS